MIITNLSARRSTWRLVLLMLLVLGTVGLTACGGGDEEAAGSEAAAASGPIKFLYFFADECAPCKEMDPIISGIETDFKDKVVVERHNAKDADAAKLMEQYELKNTPGYAMVGPDGTKLWSITGPIHKDMLRQQVQLQAQ